MTLDTWLHFLHVVSAIVWVGGGFLLSVLGARARASKDGAAMSLFAQSLRYMGIRVLMPAVIGTLVFGAWMVLENAEWNFGQFWVLFALALFVLAFVIGAIYLSGVGIQLEHLEPADTAKGQALLGRWLLGYRLVLVILLVAVWDMVFKPGL